MNRRMKTVVAGGVAAALAATAGVAMATGDDDADAPITGTALDGASAVALEHVGAGRVTETEVGDEEGFYEVEVTLEDGSQVDVHLDEAFAILGTEADGENEENEAQDD